MKTKALAETLPERCFKEYFYSPALAMWRAEEARLFASVELEEPVLDVGCGDASFAQLAFKGRTLWGVDMDFTIVRKAQKGATYNFLANADACALPFRRESFGAVVSNCVLEHIPALQAAVHEITRVLKLGGLVAFSVPSEFFGENLLLTTLLNRMGMQRLALRYAAAKNRRLSHINLLAAADWKEMLTKAGLEPLLLERYMPVSSTRRFSFWHDVFDIGGGRYNLANALKISSSPLRFVKFDRAMAAFFRRTLWSENGNGEDRASGLFIVARKVRTNG